MGQSHAPTSLLNRAVLVALLVLRPVGVTDLIGMSVSMLPVVCGCTALQAVFRLHDDFGKVLAHGCKLRLRFDVIGRSKGGFTLPIRIKNQERIPSFWDFAELASDGISDTFEVPNASRCKTGYFVQACRLVFGVESSELCRSLFHDLLLDCFPLRWDLSVFLSEYAANMRKITHRKLRQCLCGAHSGLSEAAGAAVAKLRSDLHVKQLKLRLALG